MRRESRKNDKNCISLSKFSKLYLKTPNGCVIILEQSRRGGKINLFVHTENEFVDTRGLFDFHFENQNTRSSCYENEGIFERQGSKKNMHCTAKVNILEAAKFVVQLYYKAEQRYNCTLTKVEKILAIADLIVMRDGTEMFSDKIVSHDCGVGFPVLSSFLYSNIISGGDEQSQPITCTLNEKVDIPKLYQISDDFPNYAKEILTRVFREFGDFTAKDLGLSFNLFKNGILANELIDNEKVIDEKKVPLYFKNKNDSLLNSSSVYKFIYTYPMVNYGT